MPGVGSTLGDLVEHCAADAVLCRERRGRNLDLLDSLEQSIVNVVANRQLHYASILKVIRVVRKVAVDGNRVASVVSPATLRDGLRWSAGSSWQEDIKVGPVVTSDSGSDLREFTDGLRLKHRALLRGFGLKKRCALGYDIDGLGCLADFQCGALGDYIDLKYDGLPNGILKAACRESNPVAAG